MNLDRRLREAARRLRSATEGQAPPDLHRSGRLRVLFVAQVAVAAMVVITLVTLAMSGTAEEPPAASSSTTITPATTTTLGEGDPDPATPPRLAEWAVSYPPTWDRVDNDLRADGPTGPFNSMTLATFPIRVGDEVCPHIPTFAIQDMGPTDALVSVIFTELTADIATAWPPGGYSEADFVVWDDLIAGSPIDARTCSDRFDLTFATGPRTASGMSIVVAFGPEVDQQTKDETWAIVQSLRPQPSAPGSVGQVCPVTTPGPFALTPPPPWKPFPSDEASAWWGTADLWVPLDVDGMYTIRKSVWWSQNFTDAGRESQPDIGVTYERLDGVGRPIVSGSPGTNASTPQDGRFMIAGIDPPEPGCYRVTAEYKGATLSYVYNHQPSESEPPWVTTTTGASGTVP